MRKNSLLLFLFSFAITLHCQTTFEKLYSDSIPTSFYFLGEKGNIVPLADSGYAYVNSINTGTINSIIIGRLDKTGNPIWSKTIDDTLFLYSPAITASPTNFIYVCYCYTDPISGNASSTVLKLDLLGNLTWSRSFGSATTSQQVINVIARSSCLFFTGVSSSSLYQNLFVQKTDTNGTIIWGKTYSTNTIADETLPVAFKLKNNDILLSSNTLVGVNPDNYLSLFRIDTIGNVIWNTRLRGPAYQQIQCQGMNEDAAGNIVTVGFVDSISGVGFGLWDMFTFKLSPAGIFKWGKIYGGTDYDEAWTIFPNKDKGYTVIAEPESFGNISRIAMFKIDSLGNTVWAKLYGNPFTGGYPNSALQNKDGGYTIYATNGDYSDIAPMYLIKTDSLGNTTCPQTPVTLSSNNFTPIIDSPLLTGTISGTVSFAPSIYTRTINVIDYCAPLGIGRSHEEKENEIQVYPNPNNGTFILRSGTEAKNSYLTVYNLIGEKVHEQKLNTGENLVRIFNLNKGLYHYSILQNKTQVHAGKIVIE